MQHAFKRDLSEVFTELDETPLGVGAIAQVYKAKVRPDFLVKYMQTEVIVQDNIITPDCVQTLDQDGNIISVHTSVAIKVLHPKARQIVNRDLKIMNFFAKALTLIPTMHWLSLPQEVQVFGDMMRDQLDLRIEASHLERFNDLFAGSKQIKFPKPLLAFSTKDMLMEEYEHGIPLNVFLDQAAYAKKNGEPRGVFDHKIANIGLDAFLVSIRSSTKTMECPIVDSLHCLAYADLLQLCARRPSSRQYHGEILQTICISSLATSMVTDAGPLSKG